MRGKGKRPTEGQKYSRTWDVCNCEAGQRIQAYVAGPHVFTKCHKESHPKVCLKEHAGAADCPGCLAGKDTTWYAWLPVYREPDKHEIMCAFGEAQWDVLDALIHLQPVTIGREHATGKLKGFKCPLWINPLSTRAAYAPKEKIRSAPRCIAQALIILWKYTDRITVDQLLAEDPAVVPVPVPVPVAPKAKPKARGKTIVTVGDESAVIPDETPVVDAEKAYRETVNRLARHLDPKPNGTH